MTIYDYLGIKEEELLIGYDIPKESIIENFENDYFKRQARYYFRNIDNVSLKYSLNRDERYLQVVEVRLNDPVDIERIAFYIQKAIKYRILFVFVCEERYLICWRSFNLTLSTENVYTDNTIECTSWIYDEYLDTTPLLMCDVSLIESAYDEDYIVKSHIRKTDRDNGESVYFSDIYNNVIRLHQTAVDISIVSLRYLLDWLEMHSSGFRIDFTSLLYMLVEREAYTLKDEHLFFDKDQVEYCIEILLNSKYSYNLGHTGRNPMRYFEEAKKLSTYEDEYEAISQIHSARALENILLVDVDDIVDSDDET